MTNIASHFSVQEALHTGEGAVPGGIEPSAVAVLPGPTPLALHELFLVATSSSGATHADDIIGALPGTGGRGCSGGGVCRAISGLNGRESIARLHHTALHTMKYIYMHTYMYM